MPLCRRRQGSIQRNGHHGTGSSSSDDGSDSDNWGDSAAGVLLAAGHRSVATAAHSLHAAVDVAMGSAEGEESMSGSDDDDSDDFEDDDDMSGQ